RGVGLRRPERRRDFPAAARRRVRGERSADRRRTPPGRPRRAPRASTAASGDPVTGVIALAVLVSGLTAATPLLLAAMGETLRQRATGESLSGASALKIPVRRYRIAATLAGGALAGLGGASLTLELSDTFLEGMTAGRGFIALALVAFGRWRPYSVAAACLGF